MADPLWSICIATLASRRFRLGQLLETLLPQAEKDGRTEILALHNNGERSLSAYRQDLLREAAGTYVSVVDDDDMVAPDFVEQLTARMFSGVDFIGFKVEVSEDGVTDPRLTLTGLGYDGWHETPHAMIRDVTHVNPVRRELALLAGGYQGLSSSGEDFSFVQRLRPFLRTEAVINRVLYYYRHSVGDSATHGSAGTVMRHPPLPVASPAFRWVREAAHA